MLALVSSYLPNIPILPSVHLRHAIELSPESRMAEQKPLLQ